jgi:hypothetical protein
MMFGRPCDRKAITDCYMSDADSLVTGGQIADSIWLEIALLQ